MTGLQETLADKDLMKAAQGTPVTLAGCRRFDLQHLGNFLVGQALVVPHEDDLSISMAEEGDSPVHPLREFLPGQLLPGTGAGVLQSLRLRR